MFWTEVRPDSRTYRGFVLYQSTKRQNGMRCSYEKGLYGSSVVDSRLLSRVPSVGGTPKNKEG